MAQSAQLHMIGRADALTLEERRELSPAMRGGHDGLRHRPAPPGIALERSPLPARPARAKRVLSLR